MIIVLGIKLNIFYVVRVMKLVCFKMWVLGSVLFLEEVLIFSFFLFGINSLIYFFWGDVF